MGKNSAIFEFFENPHMQTVIIMRLSICRLRAEFQPRDVSPTSGRLPGCSSTTPLPGGSTLEWKTLVLQSRSDPRGQAKCLPSLLSKVHLRFRNWRLQGVRLWRMPRKLKPLRHWYALQRNFSLSHTRDLSGDALDLKKKYNLDQRSKWQNGKMVIFLNGH